MVRENVCRMLFCFLIAGLSGLFFTACDDDDDTKGEPRKVFLLKEISGDYFSTVKYEYDAYTRLTKITTDPFIYEEEITYDKGGRIEKHVIDIISGIEPHPEPFGLIPLKGIENIHRVISNFEYKADSIFVLITHPNSDDPEDSEIVKLALTDKGLLKSLTRNNMTISYNYDSNGNIIRENFSDEYSYLYKYDGKKGMAGDDSTPVWFKQYRQYSGYNIINNVVAEDGYDNIVQFRYEYDYNEFGYPVVQRQIGVEGVNPASVNERRIKYEERIVYY